ncbi:MAG: UDP-N-acetylmuramate dehydrogenase [Muribaculaceae bacterium]|nr:UDP-N-acetylmuramate dehydrogenase [Muribaculaceae bacterium]
MIRIEHDKILTSLHTFHLKGAVASCYVEFDSTDDLTVLLTDTSLPRPLFVIGGGSNLIFNGRFGGTVIRCRDNHFTQDLPCTFTAGAGVTLDDICRHAAENGLWGAENLSAIPGEIGGAIVQNAGAYGAEIADIVISVNVYDMLTSQFLTLPRAKCHFAYRHSIFKEQPRYIILSAQLQLHTSRQTLSPYKGLDIPTDASTMQVRQAVIDIRTAKLPDPATIGSAGSFFKNPVISICKFNELQAMHPGEHIPTYAVDSSQVKIPAAWLIDRCGLKGFELNGVQVWPSQPLVLVNKSGNATAADVMAMAHTVHDTVATRYGIELTHEVVYVS